MKKLLFSWKERARHEASSAGIFDETGNHDETEFLEWAERAPAGEQWKWHNS